MFFFSEIPLALAMPPSSRAENAGLRHLLPPLPTRSYTWQKRKEVIPAQQ
jgi:hypothetical protein